MRRTITPATTPNIQIERLKHLYATKRCARALLDYAAKAIDAQMRPQMTVESLHEILDAEERAAISRRELTSTLRVLAQAGCGKFVPGRHGQPSRFIWIQPLPKLPGADSATAHGKFSNPAPSGVIHNSEPGMVSHPFRLRPNLVVSVNLPADLGAHEADRLARFIQTLPLDKKRDCPE